MKSSCILLFVNGEFSKKKSFKGMSVDGKDQPPDEFPSEILKNLADEAGSQHERIAKDIKGK